MPKKEEQPKQKQKKQPKQPKQEKPQKKRKGRSVQDFIGVKTFTKYGLMTQKGELLFYLVSPTNISVLSYVNIEIKIRHLMMVLSSIPDIEITCTDSSECFDDNKAYLHDRLDYEQNPKVRKLIKKDIEFLDNVQVEMATARQFLFTARIKASKDKQVFDTANRVEKIISEQGFEVRRMRKADIKRFLALYFEASMNGEQMPDIDGEQFYEVDEDTKPSAQSETHRKTRCVNRLDNGKKYCHNSPTLSETALQEAIVRALNKFNNEDTTTYLTLMKATIGEAIGANGGSDEIDLLERRIEALNNRMLKMVSESVEKGADMEDREDEFKSLSDQIEQLNRRIQAVRESEGSDQERQERLRQIQATIDQRSAHRDTYDDSIVRQMIECIKVYEGGRLKIIFGGGYEVEEQI